MKKVVLSVVGVLAATAFAPEASAIPAFARQVGMACSACHYQHFPALTQFGRAFKQGGYTMIGAQAKVEAETLSLPSVLNASVIGYMSYSKTNGSNAGAPTTFGSLNSNDGQLEIPQQISLFLGGRGGDHVGFEAETNIGGPGTGGTAGIIRLKVPFVTDIGGMKGEIIPFSTANGVADSFEVLNTGAVNVHTFNQWDQSAVSAQQYIGTGSIAHGAALVLSNENFFVNVAKWGASPGDGTDGGPTSNYVRGAWTTNVSGFDAAIGFQSWSGTSVDSTGGTNATYLADPVNNPLTAFNNNNTNVYGTTSLAITPLPMEVNTQATAVDMQLMGDVSGLPLLFVASYAIAPASTAASLANPGTAGYNLFNPGTLDKSSFNIAAELGIIPNVATLQLAYRNAKSGQDLGLATGGAATGQNATDNAVMIGATYNVALNVRLDMTYSMYSGDMYGDAIKAAAYAGNTAYMGNSLFTFALNFGL